LGAQAFADLCALHLADRLDPEQCHNMRGRGLGRWESDIHYEGMARILGGLALADFEREMRTIGEGHNPAEVSLCAIRYRLTLSAWMQTSLVSRRGPPIRRCLGAQHLAPCESEELADGCCAFGRVAVSKL